MRLTEGLVSMLQFQKAKDDEVAWVGTKIGVRNKNIETSLNNENKMEVEQSDEDKKILTLEPLEADEIPVHNSVLIDELKLSDFKQVLIKNYINSKFSCAVLWCNKIMVHWH